MNELPLVLVTEGSHPTPLAWLRERAGTPGRLADGAEAGARLTADAAAAGEGDLR